MTLVTRPQDLLARSSRSLNQVGHAIGTLLDHAAAATLDFVKRVARPPSRSAHAIGDLVAYAVNAAADVARAVIDAVLRRRQGDRRPVRQSIAGARLRRDQKVVSVAVRARASRSSTCSARSSQDRASDTLKARGEGGVRARQDDARVHRSRWSCSPTATAARFIEAALEAGAAVVDMLESVVRAATSCSARSSTACSRRSARSVTSSTGCSTAARRWSAGCGARRCSRSGS